MNYSLNEKLTRNAAIIADYKTGAKVPDMADFYKITTQRIYQILTHYRSKSNVKHHYGKTISHRD
jgi:Mor family transcriptional regulator